MKKVVLLILLCASQVQAIGPCSPCMQAFLFPERFHFVKAHNHGAPVESVSTLCDCCDNKFVAIAGYTSCLDGVAKSVRAYCLFTDEGNRLVEQPVIPANPSDFLYSSDMCFNDNEDPYMGGQYLVVAGSPDSQGNVVWIYHGLDCAPYPYMLAASWGSMEPNRPSLIYSVAFNCNPCIDPLTQETFYQLAVVGKDSLLHVAKICILKFTPSITPSIETQTVIELQGGLDFGGDLYKAAWLPASVQSTNPCQCNIPCTILTVAGKYVQGHDCLSGNIHNFAVTCDGVYSEIIAAQPNGNNNGGVLTLGGPDFTVRQIVWNVPSTLCCLKYPYPFMLAIGDHPIPGYIESFESLVVVYYYIPQTGQWHELATHHLPGKIFAGQFTPGCDCKSVTVGGGRLRMDACIPNIWTLTYDCPEPGKTYPVPMQEKATTSFDDIVTSFAFCTEKDMYENRICDSLIVASESRNFSNDLDPLCPITAPLGEIGVYKTYFCKQTPQPCGLASICQRSPQNISAIE